MEAKVDPARTFGVLSLATMVSGVVLDALAPADTGRGVG
jgi:hypothetical protein